MEEHKLLIHRNILLPFAITGLAVVMLAAFLKISDQEFAENYAPAIFLIALIFQIIPWFSVLIDLVRNNIRNKTLWLIGLFAFGPITAILYLFKRENNLSLL